MVRHGTGRRKAVWKLVKTMPNNTSVIGPAHETVGDEKTTVNQKVYDLLLVYELIK
jgi:hypothetical protein